MKHISTSYKFSICRRISFLIVFLLCLINIQAQEATFKNGIQQGVVKVKFDPTMTSTLSQMQIKTKGKTLSTGITSFDKAAKGISAYKMERLIPECADPVLEAKHRKAGLHLWYVVEFDQSIDPESAIQSLKAVSGVKVVQPEYRKMLIPSTITPYTPGPKTFATLPFNDPMLGDQWHYINTGQIANTTARADVNVAKAWEVTAGRSDIIVSVHDHGVDVNHEDLKPNIWINTEEIPGNGIDDDGNGYIDDIHGFNYVGLSGSIEAQPHGTHVAGTIAAVNNNGIGVSGIAGGTGNGDGVKIMSLQAIGSATAGHVFQSFVYAADKGAVISQNSWGYDVPDVCEIDLLEGIDYFINNAGSYAGSPMKGGIVFFSSGNEASGRQFWPGAYENSFAVSAIGPEWKIASYSNYGNWVQISAPGGDMKNYGVKGSILSTLPGNQYGYMDGTSMACPHVSGIAALVLANSDRQLTNKELKDIMLTSVSLDIYKVNESYFGKLGTGAIDAALAVRSDQKKAPDQVKGFKIKGIAQEFATLEWLVPADEDDQQPYLFNLYYSTTAITMANLAKCEKIQIRNSKLVGETISCEVNKLLSTTDYYFAVIATDRWGNASVLSEVIKGRTNDGPTVDVETGSAQKDITLSANIATSATATKGFTLLNKSDGELRWEYMIRNTNHTYSTSAFSAVSTLKASSTQSQVGMEKAQEEIPLVRNTEITPFAAYQTIEKRYVGGYVKFDIGDTDISIPTSGAVKFIVTEQGGFNLTKVETMVKYTLKTGPILIEVYEGGLNKDQLVYRQEYQPQNASVKRHSIALNEHLYFKEGTEFYIAVHVPPGNGFSLGVGEEKSPEYSDYCYYSSDLGASWVLLSSVGIAKAFAWEITAISQISSVTEFITLNPESGKVDGNSNATIALKADGSRLINGTYKANVIIKSNDTKNGDYRMPVTFTIAGHKPDVVYPKIAEFGSVFNHSEKTIDILLENKGYGLVKDLVATVDNPQFTIVSTSRKIEAKDAGIMRVKFAPTTAGNINGKLTVTNGQQTYTISLFGVGAATSNIDMQPSSTTTNNVTIGDQVETQFTLNNAGEFPLKYFIRGYDTQGISTDWPAKYHTYGYLIRSNDPALTQDASLVYDFNDISTTGVDITRTFVTMNYETVALGFDFPYYGANQDTLYISKCGFTAFDNTIKPGNPPQLGRGYKGCISLFGYNTAVDLSEGKIHYQIAADRIIIQYTNIEYDGVYLTAQMVLFANGDIRMYYKDIPTSSPFADFIIVLIDDLNRVDGIAAREQGDKVFLKKESVIGFDYPGPDIIKSVENGSGILVPNESVIVKVALDTKSLSEGSVKRNINVISNDPENMISTFSATLNVTAGGVMKYAVSDSKVDFGVVYKGHPTSKKFYIKNSGTKAVTISSLVNGNAKFTVAGAMTIAPGLNEIYTVTPNTVAVAELEDILTISFVDGATSNVSLKALVRDVPEPLITDLNPIAETFDIGETKKYPFKIKNTGGSDLDLSIIGGQWFRFEEITSTPITKYGYTIKEENSGEPSYNWLDITTTGTKFPYDPYDLTNKEKFWNKVDLPFTFTFYGIEYNSIKAGSHGIIALGGDPDAQSFPKNQEGLPVGDKDKSVSFICPMWSSGDFETYSFEDECGLYYQIFEDKVVLSWMYFVNRFLWGQSAQVILFKDGTIKFQYKLIDGFREGTNTVTVGIQKAGEKEFTVISNHKTLPFNQGLAYMIVPDNVHRVAANTTMEGNLILESGNIYGGTFSDSLQIKTNSPLKEKAVKYLNMVVNGAAQVGAPAEIELPDVEVVLDPVSALYQSVERELIISNTGTAPFRITGARLETGGKYLTQLIALKGAASILWTPIEELWEPYPQTLLLPGASQRTLVRFRPEAAGAYEDVLILATTLGDVRIKLKGLGYDPAVINIEDDPIHVSFNTSDQTETKSVKFDNKTGGYSLGYNMHIKYKRKANVTTSSMEDLALAKADTSIVATSMKSVSAQTPSLITYADEEVVFNRKIQYVLDVETEATIGQNSLTSSRVATRFTADNKGFTLSHIGGFGRFDKAEAGILQAEVRIGGTNIKDAQLVTSGKVRFEMENKPTTPSKITYKYTIELDNVVQILPNEDFYVIITYPMNLASPQYVKVGGVALVPGRYWWFDGGLWYDLQTEILASVDPRSGYSLFALEKNFVESGWVKIMTPESGTLQKGESAVADLKFVASFAEEGDQEATLVVRTTDINASEVKVPLSVHMNEAPQFTNMPATIMMAEKEVNKLEIPVVDRENNTFDVVVVEKPEFVKATIGTDKKVTLDITPDYGEAGTYSIKLKATDQHKAVNEKTISLNVAKTNQAPVYISQLTELMLSLERSLTKMNINDLFMDPDNDAFTFTVTSLDPTFLKVYQSGSEEFALEVVKAGKTKLKFVVTDVHGGSITHELDVTIDACMDPTAFIVQKWNHALLVNNKEANFVSYQWYKNGVEVSGATKQYYAEADGSELDFEAEYYTQMVTKEGKIVFTCPMTPLRKDVTLRVYPNPVKQGRSVKVEAQLPDLENNPLSIQVVNMSGNVVKSMTSPDNETLIPMPYTPGSYLIKVTSGNVEKTFKVVVQ